MEGGDGICWSTSKCACVAKNEYVGPLADNQRQGYGKEKWKCYDCKSCQKYTGKFLQDSLHGSGEYTWKVNGEKVTYTGLFYSSAIEGYGKISHSDLSEFEGLFKNNTRFGPGVLTYSNGRQDVGLWYGKNLIRLCKVVLPEWVPTIATSPIAKIQLLRYKKLIKICIDNLDYAENVLKEIESDDATMKHSNRLYNKTVRNRKSLFFNSTLHDDSYFLSADCFIKIASQCTSFEEDEEGALQYQCMQRLQDELENSIQVLRMLDEQRDKCQCRIFAQKEADENEMDEQASDYNTALLEAENTINALRTKIADLTQQLSIDLQTRQFAKTKQILITDLLAWNNDDLSIDMMKFAFLHRNYEKNMSYPVSDLLGGNRSEFRELGPYELDCVNFLSDCSNGNVQKVQHLLLKYDLNPDLCDAKGNTGIIYAAARDRCKIIKVIVNFGGNVDVFNDECFTPLSMCLTRYLAVQNNVCNWEAAFLKLSILDINHENSEMQHWHPHISLINMRDSRSLNDSVKSATSQYTLDKIYKSTSEDLQEEYVRAVSKQPQQFLFKTDCVQLPPKKKTKVGSASKTKKHGHRNTKAKKGITSRKGKKKTMKEPPKKLMQENLAKNTVAEESQEDPMKSKKLRAIHDTITTILQCGADPNISEMPIPALLLAIFTKNVVLIEDLLLKNADPDSKTTDEELTGMHIVVSLPPSKELNEILRLLLKYFANPNRRTNDHHWPEEKKVLVGKHNLVTTDCGKTPLHILAMRYDFVADHDSHLLSLATTLLQSDAMVDAFYIGHTPFALAILRGNIKLAKILLETGKVNPNHQLPEEMGVPLALLTLSRYNNLPSLPTCAEVIQLLVAYGANPFNSTGVRGNLIEFISKEYEVTPTGSSKKKRKDKTKKTPKVAKKNRKAQVMVQEEVKHVLENVALNVLEKHTKGYAVKMLYHFVEEHGYFDELSVNISKFVSIFEIVDIAQSLFHRGVIPANQKKNYNTMYNLIESIIKAHSPKEVGQPIASNVDISKLLENFKFNSLPKKIGFLNTPQPQVDTHREKYKVCFNCYKTINCQLLECPKCHLVYFCSEKCNLLSNLRKVSAHRCQIVFYNGQKAALEIALTQRQPGDVQSLSAVEKFQKDIASGRYGKSNSERRQRSKQREKQNSMNNKEQKTSEKNLSKYDSENAKGKEKLQHLRNKMETQNSMDHKRQKLLEKNLSKHGSEDATRNQKVQHLKKNMETQNNMKSKRQKSREKNLSSDNTKRYEKLQYLRNNMETQNNMNNKRLKSPEKNLSKYNSENAKRNEKLHHLRNNMEAQNNMNNKRLESPEKNLSKYDSENENKNSKSTEAVPPTNFYNPNLQHPRKRLPANYQCLLEKIAKYWPDFDISTLFLPYACYSEGQLYYRFSRREPIFAETYSVN